MSRPDIVVVVSHVAVVVDVNCVQLGVGSCWKYYLKIQKQMKADENRCKDEGRDGY